jgi:hypothetical protein
MIPMFNYDLGSPYTFLGGRGCPEIHARLTNHGGQLGAMLLFQRS